jgi:dolichol-phosphate mannosyltransferase
LELDLQILLPAHNERDSIGPALQEIHEAITARLSNARIVVREDGSTDGTAEFVRTLTESMPIDLHASISRKGYSRAVKEGLLSTDAPWVLCLDSDGQCDPRDFWLFWERRSESPVIVGWRRPRRDPPLRLLLSRVFQVPFRLLFPVPLHDPSCPMVLMNREVISGVVPLMGSMDQGFWWEFSARCHMAGIVPVEIPVNHRIRAAGATQIYRVRRMPGIFLRHLWALIRLRFGATT